MTTETTFQTPGIRWEAWIDRENRILRETIDNIVKRISYWRQKRKSAPAKPTASGARRPSRRAAGILK